MLFTELLEVYVNMAAIAVEYKKAILAITYSRLGDKNTL